MLPRRQSGERPLHSNPVSDYATVAAEVAQRGAEELYPEPIRRFSPLASLIVLALLSLGSWAAILAAVASMLAK